MARAPWVVCALLLLARAAAAGPVSQRGAGGGGTLMLAQEPGVDLLATDVRVEVEGEEARVRVEWLLQGPAAEREVQVAVAAAIASVELDGAGAGPAPWRAVELRADGAVLPTGTSTESPARADLLCDPTTAPVHSETQRARVRLRAGARTRLELRYTTTMTHDDWRAGSVVEKSPRSLCVRTRPVGFKARTQGMFRSRVTVIAPGNVEVAPGLKATDGAHMYEVVGDLAVAPDVRVAWTPAPARQP